MAYNLEGLRSPEYYQTLQNQPMAEAQYKLTSPAELERSRQLRSELAGKGMLSSSAFDTSQSNRVSDILSQANLAGNQLVSNAKLQDIDWARQLPFKEVELTGMYNNAPTLTGKKIQSELDTQAMQNLWFPSQYTGTTPTGANTWQKTYQTGELNVAQQKAEADKQAANLQQYLNIWNLMSGGKSPTEVGSNVMGQLGQWYNDFTGQGDGTSTPSSSYAMPTFDQYLYANYPQNSVGGVAW